DPVRAVRGSGFDRLAEDNGGFIQIRLLPGAPEPSQQCASEVGQHRGPNGLVGRGGFRSFLEKHYALTEIRLLPGTPEPYLQHASQIGKHPGSVGVTDRGGCPAGVLSIAWRKSMMPSSMSASCPVRSNRRCSAIPRLGSITSRTRWPAGARSAASRPTAMA